MEEDRFAALERELRYLRDRQEILDCVVSTARGNDRHDKDLIVGSYHPDSLHELGRNLIPGPAYGDHANHAHAAISEVNLHNVTMQSCEIEGDVAHAESYVIGLFADKGAQMSRILAGRYIDRLERREGKWRLVLRRATVEVALEGQAILPNGNGVLGSGYLKGNRDRADPSYQRPLTTEGGERW
ncbi:MAG: nuclear transport factor 2 family protein [Novosphingobium sp.]|nr:nuclear transport factor 2 family protein [Novosphingobium sp.]